MKLKFFLSFILLSLIGCKNQSNKGPNLIDANISNNLCYYEKEIMKDRLEKDKKFKHPESSPLKKEDVLLFNSLDYFAIDSTYKIWAKLSKFENSDTVLFPTTTERKPKYYIYAIANFELNEDSFKIYLYRNVAFMKDSLYKNHIFLPFSDYTSGEETYGGGRYLDLEITDSNHILIDFNNAYNPYCAYNSKYSCPIPPKENYIDTEIRAGEKDFSLKR